MGSDSVPRGRVRRAAPLAGLTARTVCGRVIAGAREAVGADSALQRYDRRAAQRYAELLGRSRGVLMKAGQILAMCDTSDWGGGGFGPYLEVLGNLHREVPAMPPGLVRELLDAELGAGVKPFAELSQYPIATASIGQVHRAVLADGRHVAVKVQYPGVDQAICDDLANAELVTTFLQLVRSATAIRVDLGPVAREAAARIGEEVNYRHEAATAAVFGELYRGHPFIRIPEVVTEASGDRVLTMTYLGGVDWDAAQEADQDLKNAWAEAIVRFVWSNLRLAGLLHADPHPTNFRFFPDGQVGFLDFGCVQVLTAAQRCSWMAMIRAALEGRTADLRDGMAHAGFLDADPTLTGEDLYRWATELLYEIIVEPQPVTYTPQSRTRMIRNLLDFQDRHHPLNRISYPCDVAFASRIQLNLVSMCATLGATIPIRAIANDTYNVSEPVTMLGHQHHAWLRRRGLTTPPADAHT